MGLTFVLAILAILQFTGIPVDASECCLSYQDALYNYHDAQFCSDYCCGTSLVALTCCSDSALQAPSYDRSDFCALWWSNNVWAPILVAIGCLAILVCCCVCCYKCCCASNKTTVVVQNPMMGQPGGMSTTVVNSNNMMTAGYSQPPPPMQGQSAQMNSYPPMNQYPPVKTDGGYAQPY